uniref:Peptidase S1 domain-containing protein n=1 Tax=Vombatus ursinus TaxID=29139 RepID=A0A4X2KCZ9_VOMUR
MVPSSSWRVRRTGVLCQALLLSLIGNLGAFDEELCMGPCGLRPWANIEDVNSRILGGKDTRLGAWPWMVSMQLVTHNGQRSHACGGSLLTSIWVLIAAHCFKGTRREDRAGASIPGPFAQERRAVHILLHEQYNSWNENNDIALVEMNEPVYCGYMVQTACLPRPSDAPVRDSEPCIIAGWGYKEENGKPEMGLWEGASCRSHWENEVERVMGL